MSPTSPGLFKGLCALLRVGIKSYHTQGQEIIPKNIFGGIQRRVNLKFNLLISDCLTNSSRVGKIPEVVTNEFPRKQFRISRKIDYTERFN